ncbi:MAG: AIPR family protein [Myxococcaceae bacterium]
MSTQTEVIALSLQEEQARRLVDPVNPSVHHFEAYLPFSEAVKLRPGNANVRPPNEKLLPFKQMMETVEEDPELFHLKNRGITYLCDRFQYDNRAKELSVTLPIIPKSRIEDDDAPRFGIADGGHTFRVIQATMDDVARLRADTEWREPFVRVHFLSTPDPEEIAIEGVVDALNTSTQVKQFTLEEYARKFEPLKEALTAAKFDISLIAFRENEQEKEWQVLEIIQRMACFLKDRWRLKPPSNMYRAKDRALQLFLADEGGEFTRLYPVIRDVITLPEFIQSKLPESVEGRKLGNVKGVKKQKKQFRKAGTEYLSNYKMDLAIVLPMAAAFRSLLAVDGKGYYWKNNPYEIFERCANDLYEVMLDRIRRVKAAAQLAFDQEYWMGCEKAVMAARDDV